MIKFLKLFSVQLTVGIYLVVTQQVATAQIRPDRTLPANSTVTSDGNTHVINGGTRAGSNLFHSFEQFSVFTGDIAHFNNAIGIENIFSRVTGGSVSQIDGLIRANGTANLFFLNPNGIVFGANAALDVGGSFVGTTANRILFADGLSFSASDAREPLLTISRPIGLGFDRNPGPISVQGPGHTLFFDFNDSSRIVAGPFLGGGQSSTGLRTSPGKTLALVGGQVRINGGILTAPSGKIEIGSVAEGIVGLSYSPVGFSFVYNEVSNFQNIQLSNGALLDASGILNGLINLQGKNLSLADGAVILISNFGNSPSGAITIQTTESVILKGINSLTSLRELNNNNIIFTGICTQAFATGKGADILITTKKLVLQNFSSLDTRSLALGDGGNINLNIEEELTIKGKPPIESAFLPSAITTLAVNLGDAGQINFSGNYLSLQDGGLMLSQTFGAGAGGNITIDASSKVEITGGFPIGADSFIPSTLGTTALTFGNGGNILVNTGQLKVEDGGRVNATTTGLGRAGNIIINARNSIEVISREPDSASFIDRSQIIASGERPDPFLVQGFGLPPHPQGDSGSITLNTNQLTVRGGLINVRNDGTGNGGDLNINAPLIFLDRGSSITAATQSGEGGNISLNSKDIRLDNGSEISATARGTGNGGNISINSDTLLLRRNSQISANAFQGRGGNIQINAKGVFVSPDSAITASSELGLDGIVEIRTPERDLQSALQGKEITLIAKDELLSTGCFARNREEKGSFINVGRGGLPVTPSEEISDFPSPVDRIDRNNETSEVKRQQFVIVYDDKPSPWQPGQPFLVPNAEMRLNGSIYFVSIMPSEQIPCNPR